MSSGLEIAKTSKALRLRIIEPNRRKRIKLAFNLLMMITSLIATACDNYPRDTKGSLKEAKKGILKVGAVENRPWVVICEDKVIGVEAELVEKFAKEIDAQIEWSRSSHPEIMKALEYAQLHLAIGGLHKDSPWGLKVTLAKPYFVSRASVGSPKIQKPLDSISGTKVAVKRHSFLKKYLKDRNAQILAVENPFKTLTHVAAEEWKLQKHQYNIGPVSLTQIGHVIAIPNGESALALKLEKFLEGEKANVWSSLLTKDYKCKNEAI